MILKKTRIAWRVGEAVGFIAGEMTTTGESCRERRPLNVVGDSVGFRVGARVGLVDVGFFVGEGDEGDADGDSVGLREVGAAVGALLTPPSKDTISARTLED